MLASFWISIQEITENVNNKVEIDWQDVQIILIVYYLLLFYSFLP